jgi:Helix-turn-helix domain
MSITPEFNKIAYFKSLRGVKLPDGAVRVLAILFSYSDPDGGGIRPGVTRLAGDCCMDERSVRRHLTLLADRGFIRQESRGGRSGDGRTRASTYRLCVPDSTGQDSPVDNASTGQRLPVDNDSQPDNSAPQPDNSASQPDNSAVSTGQHCPPTKVLPSSLSPSPLPPRGSAQPPAEVPYLESPFPPPLFCPKHPNGGVPCGACADLRRIGEAWKHTRAGKEWWLSEQLNKPGGADVTALGWYIKGRDLENRRNGFSELENVPEAKEIAATKVIDVVEPKRHVQLISESTGTGFLVARAAEKRETAAEAKARQDREVARQTNGLKELGLLEETA